MIAVTSRLAPRTENESVIKFEVLCREMKEYNPFNVVGDPDLAQMPEDIVVGAYCVEESSEGDLRIIETEYNVPHNIPLKVIEEQMIRILRGGYAAATTPVDGTHQAIA